MKAIFFDAAGTLISVREPVGVTYARIASTHGIHVSDEAVAQGFRSAWESLPQPQHGGKPAADDERGWWCELVRLTFELATGSPLPDEKLDPLFSELPSCAQTRRRIAGHRARSAGTRGFMTCATGLRD